MTSGTDFALWLENLSIRNHGYYCSKKIAAVGMPDNRGDKAITRYAASADYAAWCEQTNVERERKANEMQKVRMIRTVKDNSQEHGDRTFYGGLLYDVGEGLSHIPARLVEIYTKNDWAKKESGNAN